MLALSLCYCVLGQLFNRYRWHFATFSCTSIFHEVIWKSSRLLVEPNSAVALHGRRQGGARGCTCTPLEFENDDVIWCLHAKCTKFSLAPPALVMPTLKLGIKPWTFANKIAFLLLTHKIWAICVSGDPYVTEKLSVLLRLGIFAPPWNRNNFFAPPWKPFCRRPWAWTVNEPV